MIDVLVERQMSYKKKDQPEVALILDDILGSLKSGSRVNTLSARFRHYNIKLLLFSTIAHRLPQRDQHLRAADGAAAQVYHPPGGG